MDINGKMVSRGAPVQSAKGTPCKETVGQKQLSGSEATVESGEMIDRNAESFGVFLNSLDASAKKNIVVEQPIAISTIPPINFGEVVPGLYRSGYPQAANYPFMRSLGLKTIVTLVEKDMPEGYQQFIDENGIYHRIFAMTGTKKEEISVSLMKSIAEVVLDRGNYPLLIHCNHGKHRTGCVVGIIRKQGGMDVDAIIQEYTKYAAPKVRVTDIDYIRNFQSSVIASIKASLPRKPKITSITSK